MNQHSDGEKLMQPIPIFRFDSDLKSEILQSVKHVVERGWYILGQEVEAFEAGFAKYCGRSHCVALANGTDALELALRAVGVTDTDRVLLTANSGFYGSAAVRSIGAEPYYLDINPEHLTLSSPALESYGGPSPRAILVTHLYGQLAPEIESILAWAAARRIPVIEDCAQAHGATREGKRAGAYGQIGCFSFYPTKNLGALGDGGAIVTDNAEIALRVRQLRQYGWSSKYHNEIAGGRNSRLDEIQAAILRIKLPHLDRWNEKRRAVARAYCSAFVGFPLQLPSSLSEDYVGHLFVVRTKEREAFRTHLKIRGVATEVHYPVADHLQSAYRCSQQSGSLPVTEAACASVVTLPCYPEMSDSDLQQVITAVKTFFEGLLMSSKDRFANIGFEDFKVLAKDSTLSKYERIGFPDSYRAGHEGNIFRDIVSKLTNLEKENQKVLDIGPGASDLPSMLISHCRAMKHELHLIDSEEMLAHLPDGDGILKHPGFYPNCPDYISANRGRLDAILCYSVLHYIFVDVAFFRFIDLSLSLLAPGGQFLIGDIPNVSKRKRFFASETGIEFHKTFMKTNEAPVVDFNCIETDQIDDSVVMLIIQRARLAGLDSYILPQRPILPMANRREDILIVRP